MEYYPVHAEKQVRLNKIISKKQQNMIRTALNNYQIIDFPESMLTLCVPGQHNNLFGIDKYIITKFPTILPTQCVLITMRENRFTDFRLRRCNYIK